MDVIIGLSGVALGWALAFLTAVFRDRRDARMAGRLVLDELTQNRRFLERVVSFNGDVPLDAPPRRSAWEGVGASFLRLLDRETAEQVSTAYQSTETVWITIRFLKQTRDNADNELGILNESLKGRESDSHDAQTLRLLVQQVEGTSKGLAEYARRVKEGELPYMEAVISLVGSRVYSEK